MLVALRMLIARSVSDLGEVLIYMTSDGRFGGNNSIKEGVFGPILLSQVDIA